MRNEPWKHERRAITTHAIDYWVGWGKIEDLHRRALDLDSNKDRKECALYFVTIFESGGRKAEVVELRPEQIRWNEETIKITRMKVLKRRKTATRDVYIKIEGNPLAPVFIDYVQDCDTKFLLPGYGSSVEKDSNNRFSRKINPDKHISTTHVYNKICEIDLDIWPHWIRDQRSWHLSADLEEGGRDFDSYELKEWFGWASMDMPAHYAGRRSGKDIRAKLGIPDVTLKTVTQ